MHDADRCPQLDSIFVIVVVCRRRLEVAEASLEHGLARGRTRGRSTGAERRTGQDMLM